MTCPAWRPGWWRAGPMRGPIRAWPISWRAPVPGPRCRGWGRRAGGGALGWGERGVGVRDGAVLAGRVVRPPGGVARPGGGVPWRLETGQAGSGGGVGLGPCPRAAGPLAAGQVRVAVRAAGVDAGQV